MEKKSGAPDLNKARIAMLIDGDNAQPSLLNRMLSEVGKYGQVTLRRIYGDWTKPNMNGWKDSLNNFAVQPIQQFRYTVGKNSTDSAMIIDAMDILHSGMADAFCIVSSDSDYTRLATRIRESGTFVMGIGEQKTPKPFVNACNVFVFTEILSPKKPAVEKPVSKSTSATSKPDPKPLLIKAFEMAVHEDGWANLSEVGIHLRQLDPSFDSRTFGYDQLSQLIKAQRSLFKVKQDNKTGPSAVYVRRMGNK